MTTKLITTSKIKEIRPISDNIDSVDRLDPFIIEAQDLDIRPFLGDPLFYDLVKNVQLQKYIDFLNGKEYEYDDNMIFFDGLGIVIAYFAYARFIKHQGVNITRFGIVKKINDTSEPIPQETIEALEGAARSTAVAYLNQCEKFLDSNMITYPLWRVEESKKPRSKYRVTKVVPY